MPVLTGRFVNTSGRPYVEGKISLLDFNISGGISFLVDTGADRTLLMPDDWRLLGLDYSVLTDAIDIGGIGGSVTFLTTIATIAFAIPGKTVYIYAVEIACAPDDQDYRRYPSLLGRDILDQWKMIYNPFQKTLEFSPFHALFTCNVQADRRY